MCGAFDLPFTQLFSVLHNIFMKQTSNAIKFLLAQYRSIFKNAYFKGLATAVVVTAGLATSSGQAQADIYPWYSNESGTWKEHTGANDAPNNTWTTQIAGAVAVNEKKTGTISSGGNITIGDSGADIPEGASKPQSKIVTKTVYGGYSVFGDSVGNVATASNNKVFLISGGQVSGSGSNLVGGWAKHTGSGLAIASGNSATIISEGENNVLVAGQILGAWASSLHGATATNNTVNISTNAEATPKQTITGGIYGAQVWADAGSTEGKFSAQGNSATISHITFAGKEDAPIIAGGYVHTNGATYTTDSPAELIVTNADSLEAIGNSVSLDTVTISNPTGRGQATILAGNYVDQGFNPSDAAGGADRLVVSGNEGQASLDIKNSIINKTTAYGGAIVAANKGDASATGNTAHIINSDFSGSAIYGASITNNLAKTAISFTATGNSVLVDEAGNNNTNSSTFTTTSVIGAQISANFITDGTVDAAGADKNAAASTFTLSNNSVSIASGNTFALFEDTGDGNKLKAGNVYGAVVSIQRPGATITLNNNSVRFDGSLTGNNLISKLLDGSATDDEKGYAAGYIIGAQNTSVNGADLTGNTVTIGATATVKDGLIAAAYDNSRDFTDTPNFKNNSVVIENGAKIDNSNIYAGFYSLVVNPGSGQPDVYSQALTQDSTVTVHGAVTDSSIYGGAGAGSIVSLESDSNFTVRTDGTEEISSDVVKVAGQIEVNTNANLKISGYANEGNLAKESVNSNETSLDATARVFNRGTIELLGRTVVADGATLEAMTNGAVIKVNGGGVDNSVIDDTVHEGDRFTDFVGDRGTLVISTAQLNQYLNSGSKVIISEDTGEQDDARGAINITSGGVLEFSDSGSVNLNDFEYVSGAAVPGKILVDGSVTANTGSIIKGDDLVLAHKFASDNTNLTADDFDASGIILKAGKLTLGSNELYSADSAVIKFDHADISSNVTFATNGRVDKDATDAQNRSDFTGYRLEKADLNLDAKFDVLDVDGEHIRYEALSGTLDGADVRVKSSSGSINVVNGNWTANNHITLASGGTLQVGRAGGTDALQEHGTSLETDATLTLADGLTIDLTTANGGNSNIKVYGAVNAFYDDTVEDNDPRGHLALLDLRGGLEMIGTPGATTTSYSGVATIDVASGGVVLLNATDINTILANNQDAAGVKFSGSTHGSYVTDGDISADFSDFGGNTGFNLSHDGYLFANALSVINAGNGSEIDDGAKIQAVNFGGNILVNDLVISDHQQTKGTKPSGSGVYASEVQVTGGHAYVFNSLASDNHTVALSGAGMTFVKTAADATGGINTKQLNIGENASAEFVNGVWETQTAFNVSGTGASLTIGDHNQVGTYGTWADILDVDTKTTLTGSSLSLNGGASVDVFSDGEATFTTAALTDGAVTVYGDLTILGDANATTADGKDDATNGVSLGANITIMNNGHLTFGDAATTGAILEDNVTSTANTVTLKSGYEQISNFGGMLELGLSGSVFSADAIADLKDKLFTDDSFNSDGILKSGGTLNIGHATFVGLENKITSNGDGTYTATWNDIKGWSDIYSQNIEDITNNVLGNTIVTDIGLGVGVQGNYGALRMSSGLYDDPSTPVTIAGNTSLRNAAINNGYFISNAAGTKEFGADVQQGKILTLIGGGKIGNITLQSGNEDGTGDVERDYTILRITSDAADPVTEITAITGAGTVDYDGTIVEVNGNTAVSGNITNIDEVRVAAALSATNLDANQLGTMNGIVEVSDTITTNEADLAGGSVTTANYVFKGGVNNDDGLSIYNGATLTVTDTLDVINGGLIQVGGVLSETEAQDEAGNTLTGTGYLSVANLDLDGGTLWVDPAYGEKTSIGAVGYFKDNNSKSTMVNDAGIINGNVYVGQNAALGIGTSDISEVADAISRYQTNGSLSKDQYGSILYLNGQIQLRDGAELALNSAESIATRNDFREVLRYTVKTNVVDQYADMGLGANTAILMTEAAFEDADGNKTQTAIKFNKTGATLNAEGGDIVLVGSFDAAQKLNFLEDNDGEGHKGVYIYGQDVKVYTQNGFLFTTLEAGTEAGYGETLHVDMDKAYSVMSEASTPVIQSLISYHEDRLAQDGSTGGSTGGDKNTDQGQDTVPMTDVVAQNGTQQQAAQAEPTANERVDLTPIEPPANNTPATKVTGSSTFLNEVVTASHGAPAEAVARMALYGGAVQAAIAANTSSYEAIAARTGVGATDMGLTVANNGMGASLWLAPMYKNQDSDSFDAEGLSYGVDMNLYGVALGADFEFMPGLTAGIMFNVGSGSADGQGNAAASSVSSDFDYYGISVYGNYKYDALSITADLGYTAVDSDIDAHTGLESYGSVSTSVDSTAWTLGVTGKYTFNVGGVELAPHAGLRYSSIDLDDYSVSDIASYDADTMDIFSIPVGVTIAKEFSGEAWTVKPSLNLSVQGNFGDDTSDGTVHWTGVDGLATNVSSEMMDNFTYGATLGVSAQTGSFSMGLGVNYTGSDNVDEFGVNANARFVF